MYPGRRDQRGNRVVSTRKDVVVGEEDLVMVKGPDGECVGHVVRDDALVDDQVQRTVVMERKGQYQMTKEDPVEELEATARREWAALDTQFAGLYKEYEGEYVRDTLDRVRDDVTVIFVVGGGNAMGFFCRCCIVVCRRLFLLYVHTCQDALHRLRRRCMV